MLNRHVFIYLFGHGVPAFIGFIALVVYTHIVSPGDYGIYVVCQSVAAVVSMAFFGWIRLSVSRYQAEDQNADLRAVVLVVYGVSLLLLVAGCGLLLLAAGPRDDRLILGMILVMAVCLSAYEINQDLRRATFKPIVFTAVAVTRSLLGLLAGIVAVKAGWGGLGLVGAVALSFFVANALFSWPTWGRRLQFNELHVARRFVRYGLPLAASGLVFAVYAAIDRLAVAFLLGQDAAGRYGVASDLARQAIGVIAASVGAAVSPIAFRTMTSGSDETSDHLSKSIELLLALVAPVAIWLTTCADVLAGAMLGNAYVSTVTLLLPMLALARLFGAITNYYVHISYQLAERPFLQLTNDALILLVYVALMVPMTLQFGLPGAAAAALGSELLGFVFGLVLARQGFRLPFTPARLARVGVSLVIFGAALYGTKVAVGGPDWARLFCASIVGVTAYGVAVIVFDIGGVRRTLAAGRLYLTTMLGLQPNT
jgi:O-antigen/teichoic acid export membrane protein